MYFLQTIVTILKAFEDAVSTHPETLKVKAWPPMGPGVEKIRHVMVPSCVCSAAVKPWRSALWPSVIGKGQGNPQI